MLHVRDGFRVNGLAFYLILFRAALKQILLDWSPFNPPPPKIDLLSILFALPIGIFVTSVVQRRCQTGFFARR